MRPAELPAVLLVFAVGACGQPADELPEAVATALAAVAEECTGVGGTPHTQNAVRRIDLNGDAVDDFVLYTGWIDCENAVSIYGDRQKALTVFAGDGAGAGAAIAFADAVYDAALESADDGMRLWLTTSGAGCGRPPAASFADESFCERAIVWNAARSQFEYAPVAGVRMIE